MRALLDNSTLTAAFRAIGLIENDNRELFEMDVSALRVLVDNVVLAKEIHVLDDYKAEYSQQRRGWLAHKAFQFDAIPENVSNSMLKNARAHVINWRMAQHLGLELRDVLDDLEILFRHAWRGSESFLVLKTLGVKNKYSSTVTQALRQYLHDQELELQELKKVCPKSYNKETLRLAQSMAWAAIRTVYYRQASKLLGCEYSPHPLRNLYNIKCILFDNHPNTRKVKLHSDAVSQLNAPASKEELTRMLEEQSIQGSYYDHVNRFFRNFWQDCNSKDDNIFGVETFDAEMPPFLAVVLKHAGDRSNDVLEEMFKLRDDNKAASLRKRLSNIYLECSEDKRAKAIREFAAELRELRRYLQSYLGYHRERIPLNVKLVSYDLTVPRFMLKPYYPFKPHLAFIRDVILELQSVSSLSRQLDYLWFSTRR